MIDTVNNKDKLMRTAIDLMAEKGYQGVSTKEIASAAGVSEMTLFRNFGTKHHLLELAIDSFHYSGEMKELFSEKLVWELREDLLAISRSYHEIMNRNKKMVLIVLRSAELSDLRDMSHKHPQQLQEMLTAYFTEMRNRGKLKPTNPEAQAITFMWMNYGAFMSRLHNGDSITGVSHEEFVESSIHLFVEALTP